MPIYEYRCGTCGHTFEVMQKVDDPPVSVCEVCGGGVVRVFHPVAIHFRGSGFYTTDYGRSAKGARAARDEGEAGSARGKGTGEGGADTAGGEKKAAGATGSGGTAAKETGTG